MSRRPSRLHRDVEPEDLQGLPTRRYVRESTPGQAMPDRNGPALQRADIVRFVEKHGLQPPEHEYFDAASGTSTEGRPGLQQAAADAEAGKFKVLLMYSSSRGFRNAEDSILWKRRFTRAGVAIVFTESELVAGNQRTRWQEGVQAIADAERSAEQGRMIFNGLRQKFLAGKHNGNVALGYGRYHGEAGDPRNGELLVDDAEAATVSTLAEQYCTGRFSFASLATWANAQTGAQGQPLYRTKRGRPLSKGAVEELLRNPIYRGHVTWHPGTPEQELRPGKHEPLITAEQWETICAIRQRHSRRQGGGRGMRRVYPLSGPTVCHRCGAKYTGDTGGNNRGRRMRHAPGTDCHNRQSYSAGTLEAQFSTLLTEGFKLPKGWRAKIAAASLTQPAEAQPNADAERERLDSALANLAKLFTWGDVTEHDYRSQRAQLERALAELQPSAQPTTLPDVQQAAELLRDVGKLFAHRGVSPAQQRDFVEQFVQEVQVDDVGIAAVRLQPIFQVLVKALYPRRVWGFGRGERI